MMIVLAVIKLEKKSGQGHPPYADISGVPNLFGVCVYSFMCHHSLPSLITPIRNKSKLYNLLAYDYILILLFYLLLSFTGIYTFKDLNDIYTLNFLPDGCNTNSVTNVKFIQYFLALFPVFTLSSNFPIISITLRNNLKAIGYKVDRPYTWCVDRIVFPLLALIPPLGISLATNQVEFLVGITGSYAGAGIQYVIPAMLVFCARKQTILFSDRNIHESPFKGKFWIIFVCIWAGVCMIFVTVNHIISG
jgi:amino acid permease